MRIDPSFFFTNNTGDPHGDALGRITPLSSISFSCFLSSSSSSTDILYGLLAMGPVPGCSSIMNSTSRSGGNPGTSSGNTSGYSHTTGTSSIVFFSIEYTNCLRIHVLDFFPVLFLCGSIVTLTPLGCVNSTVLGEHLITPLCSVSQSIPSITSIPSDSRTVRSPTNSCPPIIRLTAGHSKVHLSSPKGEVVTIGLALGIIGGDCSLTNFVEI